MGSQGCCTTSGTGVVLEELHETHPGCTKMKSLAQSYIWWSKMDKDLQDVECVKRVGHLLHQLHFTRGNGLLNHGLAFISISLDRTWDKLYLVIVDASSKWLDAHIMSSMSSEKLLRPENSVCKPWTTTDDGDRQWALIYQQ